MSNKLMIGVDLCVFMKENETKEDAVKRIREAMNYMLDKEEDAWIVKYNIGEVTDINSKVTDSIK